MAEPNSQQISQTTTGTVEASEFDSLLRKEFKPKTDQAKEAVAIFSKRRLRMEQALANTDVPGKLLDPTLEMTRALRDYSARHRRFVRIFVSAIGDPAKYRRRSRSKNLYHSRCA